MSVRIALADDHSLFRAGLRQLLSLHAEFDVVAETDDADGIVPMLQGEASDVLLLDLWMGRSLARDIEEIATHTPAVVIVTATEQPAQLLSALDAGARGVVLKRSAAETLIDAIHAVHAGERWMPEEMASGVSIREEPSRLSARELDIVRHVAQGLRNVEIGRALFISEETVKSHLNTIFRKLEIRDRVELALYAIREGIVHVGSANPPSMPRA